MAKLKLLAVKDEIANIKTFVFETGGASWLAGQYQVYELAQIAGDDKAKRHYFTIASAPSEGEIHISTRISDSAFKQALNGLQVGDEIEASNLEGDFTWENDDEVVLVAGGIGVTPYRSMIIERAKQGRTIPARLLYFGRDDNFAFRSELDAIASEHPELKIDYIVGEQISADSILDHAPESKDKAVYISGAEAMVSAVGEKLTTKGVTIKQDWFPGYNDTTY